MPNMIRGVRENAYDQRMKKVELISLEMMRIHRRVYDTAHASSSSSSPRTFLITWGRRNGIEPTILSICPAQCILLL